MLTRTGQRLADWTTLRLGGPAGAFREVTDTTELYDAVAAADANGDPCLVLGGGSNVVVADAGFPGTVVHIASQGVGVRETTDGAVDVTVQAGEDWDPLVARAVDEGWVGIEALSGIPGSVGAVPIQNVGAYGQEVAEIIIGVDAFDRRTRTACELSPEDCGFGYRTSFFKQHPGRYVVGAVTFRFPLGRLSAPIRYAELAGRLGVETGQRAAAADVRQAVLGLRRRKGMVLDAPDHDTWSAGSFFTNPVVEPELVPPGGPAYPQPGGRVKISAAWLIEQAGFTKGYGRDGVGLSGKHTLALTNRGDATTSSLLALAREVRAVVEDRFGITLATEPTLVNCAL